MRCLRPDGNKVVSLIATCGLGMVGSLVVVCLCECAQLFVSLCLPCDRMATCAPNLCLKKAGIGSSTLTPMGGG